MYGTGRTVHHGDIDIDAEALQVHVGAPWVVELGRGGDWRSFGDIVGIM